jgi:hypothetical protein
MPDISSIATIFTSLKAAKDLAEAMVDLRDAAAFQSKLLEFQSKLIDANSAAFAGIGFVVCHKRRHLNAVTSAPK